MPFIPYEVLACTHISALHQYDLQTSERNNVAGLDLTDFFQQLLPYFSSHPLHALTSLLLSHIFFPPSASSVLAAVLPHLPALKHLNLSFCGIDDEGMIELVPNLLILTHLRSFNVYANRFRDGAMGALAAVMSQLTSPTYLDIAHTRHIFARQGARSFLSSLAHLSSLKELFLGGYLLGNGLCPTLAASLCRVFTS